MNAAKLKSFLGMLIEEKCTQVFPLIWGPTGAGKTSIIFQLGKQYGYNAVSIGCESITDPADFRGAIFNEMDMDSNGKMRNIMKYSMPELIKKMEDEPTILFFDEIIRTPPQSQNAIMSAFTAERRLGVFKIPESTFVCAAANPGGDNYFGNELDMAQVNRFIHISYAPSRIEILEHLGNKYISLLEDSKSGACNGVLSYFESTPDAMHIPLLPNPVRDRMRSCGRSVEGAMYLTALLLKTEMFDDIGLEVIEGLCGEHAQGIYQSVKNNYETPILFADLMSGKGSEKLDSWVGKATKVGLLSATLRNFSKAVAGNVPEWSKLTKECIKKPEVLEPLAECLAKFPADILRKYVKEIPDVGNKVLAEMVRNSGKATQYPNQAAFVDIMVSLRTMEERLQKEISDLKQK